MTQKVGFSFSDTEFTMTRSIHDKNTALPMAATACPAGSPALPRPESPHTSSWRTSGSGIGHLSFGIQGLGHQGLNQEALDRKENRIRPIVSPPFLRQFACPPG
jgi:hypothetical protein